MPGARAGKGPPTSLYAARVLAARHKGVRCVDRSTRCAWGHRAIDAPPGSLGSLKRDARDRAYVRPRFTMFITEFVSSFSLQIGLGLLLPLCLREQGCLYRRDRNEYVLSTFLWGKMASVQSGSIAVAWVHWRIFILRCLKGRFTTTPRCLLCRLVHFCLGPDDVW
jgi:hypothetical protein